MPATGERPFEKARKGAFRQRYRLPRTNAQSRGGGFTLIEMLVALAILALISGIVFPSLERGLRAHELRGAAIAAMSALRASRARAVRMDGRVRFGVSADGTALLVDGQAPDRLPAAVRAQTTPRQGIVFFGDGSSTGGTLAVIGERRGFGFVVSSTTGLVHGAT